MKRKGKTDEVSHHFIKILVGKFVRKIVMLSNNIC